MKITKQQLKQVIKEEIKNTLCKMSEADTYDADAVGAAHAAAVRRLADEEQRERHRRSVLRGADRGAHAGRETRLRYIDVPDDYPTDRYGHGRRADQLNGKEVRVTAAAEDNGLVLKFGGNSVHLAGRLRLPNGVDVGVNASLDGPSSKVIGKQLLDPDRGWHGEEYEPMDLSSMDLSSMD